MRDYRRILGVAAAASDAPASALLEQMSSTRATVSVGSDREMLLETAALLTQTLQRLPVQVHIDPAGLGEAALATLTQAAQEIDPEKPVVVGAAPEGVSVHLGGEAVAADVRAAPVRHGVHLRRDGGVLAAGASPSGLGALSCAAFCCAEVFRQAARVTPERAAPPEVISWCPVTLGDDPTLAPEGALDLDGVALVGAGGIGTALAWVLAHLPHHGSLTVIDPERFAPENVATYTLGSSADADGEGMVKTKLISHALPALKVDECPMRVEDFIAEIEAGRRRWPRTVLGALDSVAARRAMQLLWSDRIIDGATGSTMVGMTEVNFGAGPCLLCIYPQAGERDPLAELSAATGLGKSLLKRGDLLLEESHLEGLSNERREMLTGALGTPICGLAEVVGLSQLDSGGFRPSVPFASQLAAALVAGRFFAREAGLSPAENFVQFDALFGPHLATREERAVTPDCHCQRRAGVIEQVRASFAAAASTTARRH